MEDATKTGEFASQWAILPARVRYDAQLPPNAKLLFAEIAAKTNTLGYCWAHNKCFAEKLGVSADRISDLIRRLEKAGYIVVDIDPERINKERRRIYLTASAFSLVVGIGENTETSPRQKHRDGIGENTGTLKENNKEKMGYKKPGYMSLEIFKAICQWCGDDGELLLAWMQFADMRQRTRHPIATVATVERACKKIDALAAGSREYKLGLLHKATDRSWRGLFPLEPGDDGYAPTEANERRPAVWS